MVEHRVVVDLHTWETWWSHYKDLLLNTYAHGISEREDRSRLLARLKGALEGTYRPDTVSESYRPRLDNPPAA